MKPSNSFKRPERPASPSGHKPPSTVERREEILQEVKRIREQLQSDSKRAKVKHPKP